jgi:DNA polymerase-3 subunit alpha
MGDEPPPPEHSPLAHLKIGDEEWPRKQMLAYEREMLGLYVSAHPLDGTERILRKHAPRPIAAILDDPPKEGEVAIAGMIVSVDRRVNKKGEPWAIVTIEDLDASIEVLFFPKSYELLGSQLAEDSIVAVRGRVNRRESNTSVIGQDLMILDVGEVDVDGQLPVIVVLSPERVTRDVVDDLKRICVTHEGETPLRIKLQGRQSSKMLAIDDFRINPTPAFRSEVKAMLGAGCFE